MGITQVWRWLSSTDGTGTKIAHPDLWEMSYKWRARRERKSDDQRHIAFHNKPQPNFAWGTFIPELMHLICF